MAIIGDEISNVPEKFQLEYLHTVSGTGTVPSATVRICIDGEEHVQESAWGDGPVDATYAAISTAAGVDAKVEEYVIQAITSGSQAMGEVTVRIVEGDVKITGRGASTDIIEASGKAFVDALNRLAARKGRQVQRAQAV